MAQRSIHRLSDRKVKTSPSGMHCDGGGLYLQVTEGSGGALRRSWLFRFATGEIKLSPRSGKPHPVERAMGLGSFPDTSLAEARRKAMDARKLREQGIDPIVARDARRAAQALSSTKAQTFNQCCDGYVAAHSAGWGVKHTRVWTNSITGYVTPVFGRLPVAAVDTGLVLKVLEPIWTTKHETARRLRARIESVLDWARARGYREGENPARWKGHLSELLPKSTEVHIVKHHPAMPYAEVSGLIAELRKRDDRDARALELLILTASRVGAVIGARVEEFDLTARTWTIPASRMKRKGKRKATPFRVPLSDAAIAVVKRVGAKEGLLFPRCHDTSLEKAHGRAQITTHGFRSTFRDWAGEQTSYPREVIEMAMAHAIADETEEAYFRSDLFDKRRRLMDAWADFCSAAPFEQGKVVSLRGT
jgi:integrase